MTVNPKVSVVMLAYNSAKYIRSSIDSILDQTYQDFELLVVYDESIDNTLDIINEYEIKDNRVRVIKNENKKGIVGAANTGLKYAKGEYVARLDSDDISLSKRLEKQVEFLDKNPDFGLIGTGYGTIDENGKSINSKILLKGNPEKIQAIILFENYFVQSSIMTRKSVLDQVGYYSEEIPSCEDYDLWVRICEKYPTWNLPEVLVLYRIHTESDTKKQVGIREKMLSKIYIRLLDGFGIKYSDDELGTHIMMYNNSFYPDRNNIHRIENWLESLSEHNRKHNKFDNKMFNEVISEKWFDICYFCSRSLGMWIWNEYWKHFRVRNYSLKNMIKFFIKCMTAKTKG